jgi:hypothetical protein
MQVYSHRALVGGGIKMRFNRVVAGLAIVFTMLLAGQTQSQRAFAQAQPNPETRGHTAMKYPVVIGSDTLAKQYNLTSMPMTLLIDRDGRVAVSRSGMVEKDDWESKIRSLLK